jgi:hypothetical protein
MAFALAILAPARASAAGAVVGKEGETVTMSGVRLAVATTPGAAARTTLWAQVSVAGASTGFVWIVPVRPGARIDLASDAWLDALDAATSPVVLPPNVTATACDAGVVPQLVPPGTSPASTRPAQTALFTDAASLGAFVTGAGYALPPSLSSALEPLFAAGTTFVASTYDSALLPTRTLRIVDGGPPLLPLALTGGASGDTRVTAFAIAPAGASAGSSPLTLDALSVLWDGDGASTYVSAREALLDAWQGTRWLTESAYPDLLFDGAPIGAETSLPSVFGAYYALASAYGDATGDATACTAAAYTTKSDANPFAASCPAGALGVVPGPTPCPRDDDAGAPVGALFCGGTSDDAAFAVAGLAASDVWITRVEGLVTPSSASDVPICVQAAPPSSPVVTAGAFATACGALSTTPPSSGPSASIPPAASSPPSTSSGSSSSGEAAPAVAEGCGAVLDSCSSSDSSDDESDDSSGCDSDSKSDDDSSSGCGSSDSSSSSSDCATGGRVARSVRRGRSPVSRLVLLLVAGAAVARRRARSR